MAKPSPTCNIFPESCVRHPQSLTASNVGTRSIPVVGVEPAAELGPLRLLVVAEDESLRQTVCDTVGGTSFTSCAAASATEARTLLRQGGADLLLVDIDLPQNGALDLLAEVAADSPRTDVVVMTGFATAAAAMEAMRSGAHDYLAKPFTAGDLRVCLDRASERIRRNFESRRLRERMRTATGMGPIVGTSPGMEKVYRILSKVALSRHPALILGESGTGKETVGKAIHQFGKGGDKPFIICDCATGPHDGVEGELFGRSAPRRRASLLVSAGGGTVFLDEVGGLPLELQSKLLRALEERRVHPIGASQPVPFTARILAASSQDLMALVEQGRFRKDLYFRLNIAKLTLPPLRERREDIPMLAQHFLERASHNAAHSYAFSDDALRLLCNYDWPGNVRELQYAVERTLAVSSGPVLHTVDLPTQLQDFQAHTRVQEAAAAAAEEERAAEELRSIVSIAEMEKQAILGTIRQLQGDKLMAAKLLGIGKTTLYRKLKEYGEED